MHRDINKLSEHKFDLLVVGGGINGAAIAYLAADNGISVGLIDKGDFASGTSSKSTKLVHGGIRYLENFELDLVYEALHERMVQYKNAPHLVRPLPFIIPVYDNDPRSLWMVKTGVFLYDLLAGSAKMGRRQNLTAREVLDLEPLLNPQGLKGGVLYFDAQMDDARLCLENVLMADKKSACVANYVQAISLIKENRKTVGVLAKDVLSRRIFEIRSKRVICALGPWSHPIFKEDRVHARCSLRLTKGVHVVYKDLLTRQAVVIQTKKDRRIFFIIPWMGRSLIGTTDTDFSGDPDDVRCDPQDIQYLLDEAGRVFPSQKLSPDNVVSTFAGLRPLVHAKGDPSKVSRKHEIETTASGVVYVMGGKYTTYRRIAEDCLRGMIYLKSRPPLEYPLYGGGNSHQTVEELCSLYDVDVSLIEHLQSKYGTRCADVLEFVKNNESLKEPMCDCSAAIKAQVMYSLEVEMAQTFEDIYARRLGLVFIPCASGRCRQYIQETLNSYCRKERYDKANY